MEDNVEDKKGWDAIAYDAAGRDAAVREMAVCILERSKATGQTPLNICAASIMGTIYISQEMHQGANAAINQIEAFLLCYRAILIHESISNPN
jgi:hypothetical protein